MKNVEMKRIQKKTKENKGRDTEEVEKEKNVEII